MGVHFCLYYSRILLVLGACCIEMIIYEFSWRHEGIRVHLLWWFGAAVDVDENWDDTISNGKNNSLN